MSQPARLPNALIQDVKLKGEEYYNDHRWVQAFLYNAFKYGKRIDSIMLTQEDSSYMLLVSSRFDSFKKKYAIHEFNDKEIVYAVIMMLSFNKDERTAAIEDSEALIKRIRETTPQPPPTM